MPGELAEFQRAIAPFLDTWKTIDIRLIATKAEGGSWQAESGRVTLDFTGGRSTVPGLPVLPRLVAMHERWASNRLTELFAAFEKGKITLGGREVLLQKGGRGGTPLAPFTPYVRKYTRTEAGAKLNLDWTTWTLVFWDTWSDNNETRHGKLIADGQLRLASVPWEGLRELKGTFIGLPPDEAGRENIQQIELCAPLGLRFGRDTKLDPAGLTCDIQRAPTFNPRGAFLSTFLWRDARVEARSRTRLDSEGFRKKTRRVVRRPTRDAAGGATMVLGRGRWETDRLHVASFGAGPDGIRRLAFKVAGGTPEGLVDALRSGRGKPLEDAVAILFHLYGFNTAHYGNNLFPARAGTADILAFPSKGNWFLVVESTALAADAAADIAKLSTRAKAMQARALGFTVHAVWVTKQTRAELPAGAVSSAAEERVSLVTGDDFESLVELAFEDPTPDAVLKDLINRIPPSAAGF